MSWVLAKLRFSLNQRFSTVITLLPLDYFSKVVATPSNRIDWVTSKESIFRGLFPFTVFLLASFMMHFTNYHLLIHPHNQSLIRKNTICNFYNNFKILSRPTI